MSGTYTQSLAQFSLFSFPGDEDEADSDEGLLGDIGPRNVQWDRHLDITPKAVERFYRSVIKTDRCWFWIGAISSPDGYGRFTWQVNRHQRTMSAHRFALLAAGLEMTADEIGEHTCNEPLCVRVDPGHVHVSTQKANMDYAVSLGRLDSSRPAAHAALSRYDRSMRVRAALKDGWDEKKYLDAIQGVSLGQVTLF